MSSVPATRAATSDPSAHQINISQLLLPPKKNNTFSPWEGNSGNARHQCQQGNHRRNKETHVFETLCIGVYNCELWRYCGSLEFVKGGQVEKMKEMGVLGKILILQKLHIIENRK